MQDELRQQIRDEEQLKFLSIGYLISAATTAVVSLFGLFYILLGVLFGLATAFPRPEKTGHEPPESLGYIFGGIGVAFLGAGLTLALLKWRTARCIRRRRSPGFCLVIAGISCLAIPYGTLLGVATFVLLGRPSIRRVFQAGEPGPAGT